MIAPLAKISSFSHGFVVTRPQIARSVTCESEGNVMTRTRLAVAFASFSCVAVASPAVVAPVNVRRCRARQRSRIGMVRPRAGAMRQVAVAASACLVAAWSVMMPSECLSAVTELASVERATANAAGSSLEPSISGNGRYVAFASGSTKLVAGDTNAAVDIFVRDRETGRITRVSRSSSGVQANGNSRLPAISSNGRYVAFVSDATNLVSAGSPGTFVHDRQTGATERIGIRIPITWESRVGSNRLGLSADGRYVTFISVMGGGFTDLPSSTVVVLDRQSGSLHRIAQATYQRTGMSTPSISSTGRYVAFVANGAFTSGLSSSGSIGYYPTGGIYVYDRLLRRAERVDVNSNEEAGNLASKEPSISGNGRHVAFTSSATNLSVSDSNGATDVFVRDREAGTTRRVSVGPGPRQADGNSYRPSISAYGRHVAFVSDAGNLVSSDQNGVADIFLRDRQTGVTHLLSVDSNGRQGDLASDSPSINVDGRYVAFGSYASDLVLNDFNTSSDVFLRDRGGVLP
jgi:Tol biopolymer transport system component